MNTTNYNTNSCTNEPKKEVFLRTYSFGAPSKKGVLLRTFSFENEDPDGSIIAAQKSLWITYNRTLNIDKTKLRQLYKTADSILQAVNDGSCDFLYTMRPRDKSEVMDSFTTYYLPLIVEAMTEYCREKIEAKTIKCPDKPLEQGMLRLACRGLPKVDF